MMGLPTRTAVAVSAIALAMGVVTSSEAQSLSDQIERVRERQATKRAASEYEPPSIRERMRTVVDTVIIEDATARSAFQWWSDVTRVPLVLDWQALEDEGVDPDRPINVRLSDVPAGQLLAILMRQAAPGIELMYESTPWYVQIMTKAQANRQLVTRVYLVHDLVMEIPNFVGPSMDLNDSLSNTSSGGSNQGGGGNVGGIFDDDQILTEQGPSKTERGENLATMIMDTIEPDLWNDAEGASVSYFNGKLIVSAPLYVHRQIGIPAVTERRTPRRFSSSDRRGIGDLDPISGVSQPTPIAAVERR